MVLSDSLYRCVELYDNYNNLIWDVSKHMKSKKAMVTFSFTI